MDCFLEQRAGFGELELETHFRVFKFFLSVILSMFYILATCFLSFENMSWR